MGEHLRCNLLIGRALRKYDNWERLILHKTKNQSKANKLEIAAIAAHNSIAPGGYNLALGGFSGKPHLGHHHSEEARMKISDGHLGTEHSEETRKKISETGKEVQNRPEAIIKIILANMGLPYINKVAKEALQKRLEWWQNHKPIIHGKDWQKIRIANIKKCLRWLAAGGTIE